MAKVYLALGSNVGDSHSYIESTIEQCKMFLHDVEQAPIYISKAIGYTDQSDFLNTVICGQCSLRPFELLQELKGIEKKIGRIKRFRWGPREIDIDIILYDDIVLESDRLTIPHPRFRERDFVLQPLADLGPNLVDPVSQKQIKSLLEELNPELSSNLRKLA